MMGDFSSFFDEQSRRQKQTWFFLFLGLIWIILLGYLVAFVNVEFLRLLEVLNLTSQELTRVYVYAVIISVLLWAVITIVLNFYSFSIFPRLVGAHKAGDNALKKLSRCVEEMAIASGEPASRIRWYVMDSPELNAFACGRSVEKGSIVVTSGLLGVLDEEELKAVLAHELAHLKNGDAGFISNAVAFVLMVIGCGLAAYGLVTIILALILGTFVLIMKIFEDEAVGCVVGIISFCLLIYALIHLGIYILLMGIVLGLVALAIKVASSSISMMREYLADACAVQWTRNPVALASALQKISGKSRIDRISGLLISPLWLENPYVEDKSSLSGKAYRFLMQTHPSVESRLERLRAMAGSIAVTEARFLLEFRKTGWQRLKSWLIPLLLTFFTVFVGWVAIKSYLPLAGGQNKTVSQSQKAENKEQIQLGFVNQPVVNVRETPSLEARVIRKLTQYSAVKILGEKNDWYYVEWVEQGQAKRGWIAKRLITRK